MKTAGNGGHGHNTIMQLIQGKEGGGVGLQLLWMDGRVKKECFVGLFCGTLQVKRCGCLGLLHSAGCFRLCQHSIEIVGGTLQELPLEGG